MLPRLRHARHWFVGGLAPTAPDVASRFVILRFCCVMRDTYPRPALPRRCPTPFFLLLLIFLFIIISINNFIMFLYFVLCFFFFCIVACLRFFCFSVFHQVIISAQAYKLVKGRFTPIVVFPDDYVRVIKEQRWVPWCLTQRRCPRRPHYDVVVRSIFFFFFHGGDSYS